MAEPIEIRGREYQGKIRNPLGVVGLTFVTIGIYGIFWYYFINKEMAEYGAAKNSPQELGDSPATSVIAITLGAFVLVPPFVSFYNCFQRLRAGERLSGAPQGLDPGLGLLLAIFVFPIAQWFIQSNWDKVLHAQAGGGGVQQLQEPAAVPQPEEPAVPPAPAEQPPQAQ
jgi:hypothetical protein